MTETVAEGVAPCNQAPILVNAHKEQPCYANITMIDNSMKSLK